MDAGQLARFLKNGSALALGGVIAQLAFVFIEVLLARQLGATAYGTFAAVYSFVLLIAFVIDAGLGPYTIQEGSRDSSKLTELLSQCLLFKTIVFAGMYGLAVVILLNLPLKMDFVALCLVFGIFAYLMSVQDNLGAVFAARQEMHINAVFQAAIPLVVLVVFLVLTQFAELSLIVAASSFVIGAAVVVAVWLAWATRQHQLFFAGIVNSFGIVRRSYHYGLTGLLNQLFYKTDIMIIAIVSSVTEAGIYAAAFKFADVFFKVPILLGRVVMPSLFRAGSDPVAFGSIASFYMRVMVAIGTVAACMTALAADHLVDWVFGNEFSEAAVVLRVVACAMAMKCLMVVSEGILSATGKHFERWSSLIVVVIFNLVLCVILTHLYGAVGTAVATICSQILLVSLFVLRGFRQEIRRKLPRLYVAPVLNGVLLVAVAYLVAGANPLAAVPAVLAAQLLVLALLRVVSREDILLLRGLRGGT